jgi:hypothetical protein
MTAKVAATLSKTIGNSRACASPPTKAGKDTMQYITQCPHYSRLITRRFRKDNYLLFQIVKEPEEWWWVWMDSNHRPPPYQDGALTN